MKRVFSVLAMLFALAISSTTANAQFGGFNLNKLVDTVKKGVDATRDMTEAEEIDAGEGMAAVLLGAMPLHADDNLQRYINRVGRWVASQSARPDLPWSFGVLDSPTINAFAAPGGKVFVSVGLMKRLKSEAELAGVLAHEVAHVALKHQVQAIQAAKKAGMVKDFAQEEANKRIARTSAGGNPLTGALATAAAGEAIELMKNGVLLRPLDRALEYDADRLGVVLATRSGYDPYGLVAVMQMLATTKSDDSGFSMLSTHPAANDRLNELEKNISALDKYASQPVVDTRYLQMMAAVK
jgi:predicted Zn-dependent protease